MSEQELQDAILREKAKGVPDIEIGNKYGVTYKYIEKVITKAKGLNISSFRPKKKIKYIAPKEFSEEKTTVWSFRSRGDWATHSGEYRGNYSPYIPRNIIIKYSRPGDLVLDYFCGAGTTAVEAKLLGRKCIALDINDKAIELAKEKVDFSLEEEQLSLIKNKTKSIRYEPELFVGDARDLSFLENNSVDLICSHPPYANIIHYTDSKKGDLSLLDIEEFLTEMKEVAKESFRVLKPGKQCAILIGDTRRKKHVIPLGFKLINIFLESGFQLKELIIKRQHNCKTTGFWYANSIKYNFLLLAHEYLPVFEKPKSRIKRVSEDHVLYKKVYYSDEKPKFMKKIEELETTTVWIFGEKSFEEYLNNNVIERYSDGKSYSIKTVNHYSENKKDNPQKNSDKPVDLFFVKSPCFSELSGIMDIHDYLKKIIVIQNEEESCIKKGGYLVIQTQDMRRGEYVIPLAKKIIDEISSDKFWLKEIVVVTKNGSSFKNYSGKKGGSLEIVHNYLLVYKKIS